MCRMLQVRHTSALGDMNDGGRRMNANHGTGATTLPVNHAAPSVSHACWAVAICVKTSSSRHLRIKYVGARRPQQHAMQRLHASHAACMQQRSHACRRRQQQQPSSSQQRSVACSRRRRRARYAGGGRRRRRAAAAPPRDPIDPRSDPSTAAVR
jgi:hypothetical protein